MGKVFSLVEVIWEKRENHFPSQKIACVNLALFE